MTVPVMVMMLPSDHDSASDGDDVASLTMTVPVMVMMLPSDHDSASDGDDVAV